MFSTLLSFVCYFIIYIYIYIERLYVDLMFHVLHVMYCFIYNVSIITVPSNM